MISVLLLLLAVLLGAAIGATWNRFQNRHRHDFEPWRQVAEYQKTAENPHRTIGTVIEQRRECKACGWVQIKYEESGIDPY